MVPILGVLLTFFFRYKQFCGEENLCKTDSYGNNFFHVHKIARDGSCKSLCKPSTSNIFEKRGWTCGLCLAPECSCDDSDLCTVDSCDSITGECTHTPIQCGDGELCDSFTGTCVSTESLVPCVAVVDEWNNRNYTSTWQTFRDQYPQRPFCLLVPTFSPDTVIDTLYVCFLTCCSIAQSLVPQTRFPCLQPSRI